ncbi:MAG TPA: glycosyltransferase family 39 protein [Geminicoccaceae bacterium]|nr:glycosyltransferase family 39 protein [Geminicoccaceae bacterium]
MAARLTELVPGAPAAAPRPALAWLGSETAVGLLILGWLAVHLALRLLTSPTLGVDDAEQALLAQRFAWGYQLRQPPLYTWLLLPLIAALGPNLLALSLLRYFLLGLTFLCLYGIARRWIADPRLAGLAVLSYSAIYMFGYYAHHDLTHTTALAAMVAASFYAFARLVERPSATAYAALGACFGLGMLAKWNFVMLALGLPLTCLLHRRLRPLVLDLRLLLALAAMALVVTPAALWALGQQQGVGGAATAVLGSGPGQGFWATLGRGTAELARASLAYPLPFGALFLLSFGSALWRARAAARPKPGAAVTPGFLATLIAVVLVLHWLLIPTLRAVAFTEHWLHPALMILPILLFALVERGRPTPRALRGFLVLLGLTFALALGGRVAHYALGADHCGRCRDLVPFEALADQLRKAGFARGTIVADDVHIGGNFRVLFPDSRVIDPAFPAGTWPPPTGDGQCLLLWPEDDRNAGSRPASVRALETGLGLPAAAPRPVGRVEAAMPGSASRRYALGYELLDPGVGECR